MAGRRGPATQPDQVVACGGIPAEVGTESGNHFAHAHPTAETFSIDTYPDERTFGGHTYPDGYIRAPLSFIDAPFGYTHIATLFGTYPDEYIDEPFAIVGLGGSAFDDYIDAPSDGHLGTLFGGSTFDAFGGHTYPDSYIDAPFTIDGYFGFGGSGSGTSLAGHPFETFRTFPDGYIDAPFDLDGHLGTIFGGSAFGTFDTPEDEEVPLQGTGSPGSGIKGPIVVHRELFFDDPGTALLDK